MSQSGLSNCQDLQRYLLRDVSNPSLDVEICFNSNPVCKISGIKAANQFSLTIQNPHPPIIEEIFQSSKYVGAIPMSFSFMNRNSSASIDKLSSATDFTTWFNTQIANKTIVTDTNILLNRIFSAYELKSSTSLVTSRFEIPRLAILELERQANEKNNGNQSTPHNYNKGLKKRKAFLGFGELLYLKKKGAQQMPELQIETLTGFSKISGDGFTDAWIRREIHDRRIFLMHVRTPFFPVFITADMTNAVSALAEGIDTIYVSPIRDWTQHIQTMNIEQVSQFICLLAVLVNEITIFVSTNRSLVRGFWSGITTANVINQDILVSPIS